MVAAITYTPLRYTLAHGTFLKLVLMQDVHATMFAADLYFALFRFVNLYYHQLGPEPGLQVSKAIKSVCACRHAEQQ